MGAHGVFGHGGRSRRGRTGFSVRAPVSLFDLADYLQFGIESAYEVSPIDGRFLMVKPVVGNAPSQSIAIVNWFDELERLVPSK